MTTPIYQSLGELSLGPDMAHTQAGRRGQNARVISAPSIPRDPELYYDLEKTASRHGTTTNVEESIDSKALAFKRLERQPGREGFTFSGREDFTVHFRNRKKKSLWCDCANAAPCSHIYYALNQLAKLSSHQQRIDQSLGILYIDARNADAEPDRRVILELDRVTLGLDKEDIWPYTIIHDDVAALDYANDFIHRRTRLDQFPNVAVMKASLHLQYSENTFKQLEFPDRPIHTSKMAKLWPIIAKVCLENEAYAQEFQAVLTPVTQIAERIEEYHCLAERALAALTERWLFCDITDEYESHHVRQVQRNLETCAYRVWAAYRPLATSEAFRDVDISEATHAAASALICMIGGALKRNVPQDNASLWSEMMLLDYDPHDPSKFWTVTFKTFELIVLAPRGLSTKQRHKMGEIYRLANVTSPRQPGILRELARYGRRSG